MSVSIANTTAGISGKTVELAESDQTITGLKTFDRDPSAPFAVSANSAVVTNLDADKLDGVEASAFLQKSGGTMTGALIGAAGTVGAPGVAVSESDCGLYSSGTNALDFATNGTKALGINSTQQIGSPTQFRCSAYRNTTQSIGSGAFTSVQLNAEDYDVGTLHDVVSNNTRITIPTGGDGLYLVVGRFAFAANSTGVRAGRLYKNGSTALAQANAVNAGASDAVALTIVDVTNLVATDYIELQVYQNSGGNLDTGHATARELQSGLQLIRLW